MNTSTLLQIIAVTYSWTGIPVRVDDLLLLAASKKIIKEKKVIAVALDVWPALSNLLSNIIIRTVPPIHLHTVYSISWDSRVPKHVSRDGLLHSPVTLSLPDDP